jgi:hypothetical protein
MRTLVLLAIAVILGAIGGWLLRDFTQQPVMAAGSFEFTDKLADPQVPYLSAVGTWRGDLADKINAVEITCDNRDRLCQVQQANITNLGGHQYLTLHSKHFQIEQSDADSLRAVGFDDLCIRETLLIDRKAKAVSLVRTKINQEEICAMVQNSPVTNYLADPPSK